MGLKTFRELVESLSSKQQTFEELIRHRDMVEQLLKKHKTDLERIKGDARGPFGMTPDSIKADPKWKEAKRAVDSLFAELQKVNAILTRDYKKELAQTRRNR